MREQGQILPAAGKLGVLTAGMGAVTTTFIAGLEAVRPGLAKPIGSLTQMGTVRLGERTDNRSPKIGDFVQLANLKGRYAAGGTLSGQRVWGGAERGRLSLKALRESWFRYSNLVSPMPFDLQ